MKAEFKSRIKETAAYLRSLDYRHYISLGISLTFIGLAFLFPNALPRFAESVRDLITSFLYYFCELVFPDNNPIVPTVTFPQTWKWAEETYWQPLSLFPYEWEEFTVLWSEFWGKLFTGENFLEWWYSLSGVIIFIAQLLLPLTCIFALVFLKIRGYTNKKPNKFKGDSAQLRAFKKFQFKVIYPVIAWCKDFVFFLKENKKYWQFWLTVWLLYFNLLSIAVAFFAFYVYFVVSYDVIGIYTQFVKLFADLTPMIRFLPGVVWFGISVYVYNYVCRSMAFARLYAFERANRSFLKQRGVVTTVYGEMGTGKTQLITSMALSAEIEQWDNAFEIMLEMDLMFPNFPWQRLRDYLRRAINNRDLCDLDAVRDKMETFRRGFDYVLEQGFTPAAWRAHFKANKQLIKTDYTFGYDFEHYRHTYDDNLKVTHLFDAVSDYACAYLVFTVRTSLIFANYSIRVDSMLKDFGNMPLRDNDFLNRDSRYMKAYSRQCHIINFDMLRLGKRMQKVFKLSFGVYVITEIDKERKNTIELKETKKSDEECNQNNDLFNACLMMCRHAAVIANRVFIRIICDLQRPEAWGAGGRELGEVIYISSKEEAAPVLPFFSPYWLLEWIFSGIKAKWKEFHSKYIHKRRDGTLFAYSVDNVTSAINHHYDKVNGLFGAFTLHLEIQSGRMDGEVKKDKWRIILKKDRSARYKTDCLNSVFDTFEPNTLHIDDFICYAGDVGTLRENGLQESYFQNDVIKMKKAA